MSNEKTESFFAKKMTSRHLLTSRIVIGVGVVLAGAATALFAFQQRPEKEEGKARLLKVETVCLAQLEAPQMKQSFTGIVMARRSSLLSAKAVGRVDRIPVDVGDSVARGQALVELDREQLEADHEAVKQSLAAAQSRLTELQAGPRDQEIKSAIARIDELRATLRLSQANLSRVSSLRDSGSVSPQEVEERQAEVDALEAQLRSADEALSLLNEGTRREQIDAQKQQVLSLQSQLESLRVRLEERTVVAPYDARVQSRMIDEGTVVAPGQALLEIVEVDQMEVQVGLPASLHQDAMHNVEVMLDGSDKSIEVSFDRMAPAIDATTRTRQCIFRVDQADFVELGDSVRVLVSQTSKDSQTGTIWVPSESLAAGPRGLWLLYVVEPVERDGTVIEGEFKVAQRPVELLRAYKDWSEVRGPLVKEERLIVNGLHRVVPGQIVRTN